MSPYDVIGPEGTVAVVAGVAMLLTSAFVLYAAPRRKINQAFATFGFVAGPTHLAEGVRKLQGWPDAISPLGGALNGVFLALIIPWSLLWLRLAAASVAGPILGPLATPRAQRGLVIAAIISSPLHYVWARDGNFWAQTIGGLWLLIVAIVVVVGVAWATVRFEQGTEDRRRANAYLGAFVAHDLGWLALLVFNLLGNIMHAATGTRWGGDPALRRAFVGVLDVTYLLIAFAFIPLILVGMFRGRLLGIEDRVRQSIATSIAVATVAALFFVIVELIESYVNVGNTALSVATAAGLALAFRPLKLLAERGAQRFVPRRPVSPAEYEAALKRALADGTITPHEQRVLDELAARMRDRARRSTSGKH